MAGAMESKFRALMMPAVCSRSWQKKTSGTTRIGRGANLAGEVLARGLYSRGARGPIGVRL